MSLKLYTDKKEVFECTIQLEGVQLSDSKIRAILNFDNNNKYLIEGRVVTTERSTDGTVKASGKAVIPFPKLKNIAEAGMGGNMQLEIIADDAYFQPYEERFTVDTSKKATVEVVTKQEQKPSVVIEKISPINDLTKMLVEKGITKKELYDNKDKFSKVLHTYYQQANINESYKEFLQIIINRLQ